MLMIIVTNNRTVFSHRWVIIVGFFFMALYCNFFGVAVDAASRWITIGPFILNAAELMLLLIIPISCLIYKGNVDGGGAVYSVLLVVFFSTILLLQLPAMPHVIQLILCAIPMLFISILSKFNSEDNHWPLFTLSLCTAIVLFTILFMKIDSHVSANTMSRYMELFLSRGASDPGGVGYQSYNSLQWLSSSSLVGSAQLPELNGMSIEQSVPRLASVFPIIYLIVRYGWLLGGCVISVLFIFFVATKRMINKIRNQYDYFLSLGCWMVLFIRFTFGLLINFSLIPTIDIEVPFLSYGGTSNIVDLILVGVIFSSFNYNNILRPAPNVERDKKKGILVRLGKDVKNLKDNVKEIYGH
jgi:cell division protein FtsW (lipid II flippase)